MKQERGTQAGGCSSAVERVLRMYEAPGSTPGSSTRAFSSTITSFPLRGVWCRPGRGRSRRNAGEEGTAARPPEAPRGSHIHGDVYRGSHLAEPLKSRAGKGKNSSVTFPGFEEHHAVQGAAAGLLCFQLAPRVPPTAPPLPGTPGPRRCEPRQAPAGWAVGAYQPCGSLSRNLGAGARR